MPTWEMRGRSDRATATYDEGPDRIGRGLATVSEWWRGQPSSRSTLHCWTSVPPVSGRSTTPSATHWALASSSVSVSSTGGRVGLGRFGVLGMPPPPPPPVVTGGSSTGGSSAGSSEGPSLPPPVVTVPEPPSLPPPSFPPPLLPFAPPPAFFGSGAGAK